MVEQRPSEYNGREGDIPLSDKYSFRYMEAEQTRDETLERILTGVQPNIRRDYQGLMELQKEGQQISHPDFVDQNRRLIVATLPVFRLSLRKYRVRELFNELLEELNPENRDSTVLPIRESPLTITTTKWDPSSQDFLQMYVLADSNALSDTLKQFDPFEAVDTFLTSLEDTTPLLPFLTPNIASAWSGSKKLQPERVIKAKTKLMGVHVEYRPDVPVYSGIARTTIAINPLR